MNKYIKTNLQNIKELRNLHFYSIYEPQELFIELMVPDADKYIIQSNNEDIGYFIVTKDSTIIEFYLHPVCIPKCNTIFRDILNHFNIGNAYCKSFDSLFLKVCLHTYQSMNIIGVLYREFTDKEITLPGAIQEIRIANMADYEDIVNIMDGVFDTNEEVSETIQRNAVFVFRNKINLIGFGIFQPSIDGGRSCDIGMAVSPEYRGKGYGTYILNYLKNHCIKNNWRPTCGCAIENIASKKTIEKVGFVSRYNMLEFLF